jgi:lipopolysaccharide transport system permease protein
LNLHIGTSGEFDAMSVSGLQEVVYTPEPQLRSPGKLLGNMVRDLFTARELAWRLVVRDISAQYRQTMLGYFWAVFPPLVTSLIFILLNSSNILTMKETGIPYPAYIIMGTVFFALFVDALNAPLKQVNASKAMLVKINFPREALVLAAIGQVLFSFGIKLILLVATLVFFQVPFQPTILLTPIPLAGLLLIGIMLGVLLVPLGALFHDITYGLTIASSALMLLTPVVYPPPTEGLLAKITAYNPLTPLLMAAREFVVAGSGAYLPSTLVVLLAALALLFPTWLILRLALPILIERIGA